MTLCNIADMLADILQFKDIYAGDINANLERSIGVYNAKRGGIHKICIGGKACTKTLEKKISILIHWTDNPTLAEQEAERILDLLTDIRQYEAGDFIVRFLKCNDPVSVGKDDRGIYEYVIEAIVYYERKV